MTGPDAPDETAPTEPDQPDQLAALVDRVPAGWSEVAYAGRTWGLTRTDHAHGGTTSLFAEQLGGPGFVSANVWRTSGGAVLRPCEMPDRDVLDFLRGWTTAGRTAPPGRRAEP